MLDHKIKYELRNPVKIIFDIETSCCDDVYRAIPQPNNK